MNGQENGPSQFNKKGENYHTVYRNKTNDLKQRIIHKIRNNKTLKESEWMLCVASILWRYILET